MIRVAQSNDDCYSACLASILEIDLSDVPRFCGMPAPWTGATNQWLSNYGLYHLRVAKNHVFDQDVSPWAGFCIIDGESTRSSHGHSVVGFGGMPVFDPFCDEYVSPEGRAGSLPKRYPWLVPHTPETPWVYTYLVPYNLGDWERNR